jgi:AbrB family looped-hinge helix DNA binding protein
MESVTLSASYRIIIPKSVRRALNLAPGQRLRVFAYGTASNAYPSGHRRAARFPARPGHERATGR